MAVLILYSAQAGQITHAAMAVTAVAALALLIGVLYCRDAD